MSDISRIQNFIDEKDTDAGILYNDYVQNLYSYGISLGFPHDICMDAIHDIFCKLYYLKKDEISAIENVKHYLFRSLKNRLLDIHKKNKNIDVTDDASSLSFDIEVSVLDTMIEEEDKALMIKKVESLMSSLTDRQKEAIYLRYIQEMSYDEIANLLGMTPKSARMLVFRAMDKMRDLSLNERIMFFTILCTSFVKNL
ncbi:RNA polymerase sigma factor [Prevotella sp. 10(H)]|uniref:RNA polymerase sigma factor n=1 Tax=Prevotella sp. 10(H) TaxID=1158294 RepID=UPI0009E021EB|nr:sigma-70 family RNA polymerase sigma factor [Prevotella sp. 10(H)]